MGKGWQLDAQPSVVAGSGWAAVTFDSQDTYWYNVSGNTYTPQFGVTQSLVPDTTDHLLKFIDTDGTVYEFNDFSSNYAALEQGQLARIVSPNGATEVVSYLPSGQDAGKVNTIQYFSSGQSQAYQKLSYAYIDSASDPNEGEVQAITLQGYSTTTQQLVNLQKVTYTYYVTGSSEPNGDTSDLKEAVTQQWDPASSHWIGDNAGDPTPETSYYRYYIDSANGSGYADGLKMVISPQGFQDASSHYSDPTSSNVSDSSLLSYSSAVLPIQFQPASDERERRWPLCLHLRIQHDIRQRLQPVEGRNCRDAAGPKHVYHLYELLGRNAVDRPVRCQ